MNKLFLFDFDGTIADTFDLFIEALTTELTRRDITPPKDIRKLRGLSARAIFKQLGIPIWKVPFVVGKVKPEIVKGLATAKPFAGVKAAMATLAKQGRVVVLTSNDQEAVEAFLAKHKIAVHSVRGDIGVFGKKQFMQRAVKDAGVALDETVYIGDELRDFEAAQAAGVHCALVAWGYNTPAALKAAKPDWFVKTPKELVKLTVKPKPR